jgi:hypothetical protein
MTSHQDQRHDRLSSSRDYQREAEHTRRRLAEGLDELSDRLTPGQVFDEMLTYSRAGSGTFLRAFSNAMRENPLPSLLIGAGCMMFLSEKMGIGRPASGNGRANGRVMRAADEAYETSPAGEATVRMSDAASRVAGSAASTARSAAASVQAGLRHTSDLAGQQAANAAGAVRQGAAAFGESVAGATDAVRSTTHDIAGQASGAVDQMRQGVKSAAGMARDYSSALGDRIVDTADRTRRQTTGLVRQTRESATSFITEQPLLCAAIGVAVGAAIASMLPSTDTEDEWMGEASDSVKSAAGQVGSDALDSAKDVAGKLAGHAQMAVQEAVKGEALSPRGVADAARKLGEGIRQGTSQMRPASGSGPQQETSQPPTSGVGPQEGAGSQLL